MVRTKASRRMTFFVEELESRRVPTSVVVPLDPNLDQFGDQIGTIQAYGDPSNSTFGIFDTGAAAITFSPDDQDTLQLPIAYPGGAIAGGIGGIITGDISEPGTIYADGLHSLNLDTFEITLNPATRAATPGIQAFVGTANGSPNLPTITGTPILNSSPAHPNGLAAKVNMQGFSLDFGDLIPGLTFAMPDLHFVEPGTPPDTSDDTTTPVYIPLGLFGSDNHLDPGANITESHSPTQENVSIVYQDSALGVSNKRFLFDTGAQLSILSTSTALALGIDLDDPETAMQVQGVGGADTLPGYTVSQLVVPTTDGGTVTFTNVPVYVLDVAPDLDGILGMNLFDTANSFVYDPFNVAGPRLGVTFHTTPRDVVDDEFGDLLGGGFPFFGGLLYGHSLPGFTVVATPVDTATTLTATPNASTGGSLVTFTATISPSPGNLGTVAFKENGIALPGGAAVPVQNGVAQLQISSLTTGNHQVIASYSGATGFAASSSNAVAEVVANAPHIVSITPNGNIPSLAGGQRSRVASLVVTFDEPVSLDADAMTLALHTNHVAFGGVDYPHGFGSLPTTLALSTTDNITWIATFVGNTESLASGANDGFKSIKDGVYDLNINAAKVHPRDVFGVSMAANTSFTFNRLFGDVEAPATPSGGIAGVDFTANVNTSDNLTFRNGFNNPANYRAYLDTDGDNQVNTADSLQFRNRFNRPLSWKV